MRHFILTAAIAVAVAAPAAAQSAGAAGSVGASGTVASPGGTTSPTLQTGPGQTGPSVGAQTGTSPGARNRAATRTEPPGRVPTTDLSRAPSATTSTGVAGEGRVAPLPEPSAQPMTPPR